MKTYEEMKDEVFRRVDDFEAEKKHRRKLYIKAAAAVLPLCAAGGAVFALWCGGALGRDNVTQSGLSFNAIAEVESFDVTCAEDAPTEKMTMVTAVAVSGVDKPKEKNAENVTGASDSEVKPQTEDKTASEEQGDNEEKPTEAPRTTEAERTAIVQTTACLVTTSEVTNAVIGGDFYAWVEINGETYNQIPEYNGKADAFTKGSYVGTASQFDSYYSQGLSDADSDLYTVEGHEDWLILEYRYPASGMLILQKK